MCINAYRVVDGHFKRSIFILIDEFPRNNYAQKKSTLPQFDAWAWILNNMNTMEMKLQSGSKLVLT